MWPTDPNKNNSLRAAALQGGGGFSLQGNTPNANIQLPSNIKLGPVQVAHPQPLQVGNSAIQPGGGTAGAVAPTHFDWRHNTGGDLVNNLLGGVIKPFAATPIDLGYDFAKSRAGQAIGLHAPLSIDSGPDWLNNVAAGSGATGTGRNLAGNAAQIALTAGAGLVGKGVGWAARPLLGRIASPLAAGITKGALEGGIVGGGFNTAGLVGSNENLNPGNVAKAFGTGFAVGAPLGGVAGGLGSTLSKRASNIGIDKNTLNFLKEEKDPNAIHTVLSNLAGGSSDALKQAAADISKSNDAKFIIHRLEELPQEAGAATVVAGAAGDAIAKDEMAQGKAQARQAQQGPSNHAQDNTANFTPEEVQAAQEAGVQHPEIPAPETPPLETPSEPVKTTPTSTAAEGAKPGAAPRSVPEIVAEHNSLGQQLAEALNKGDTAKVNTIQKRLEELDQEMKASQAFQTNAVQATKQVGQEAKAVTPQEPIAPPKEQVAKEAIAQAAATSKPVEAMTEQELLDRNEQIGKEFKAIPGTREGPSDAQTFVPAKGYEAKYSQLQREARDVAQQINHLRNPDAYKPAGASTTDATNANADITKLPTELPKGTNAVQRTFLSVRGELSKMGEAGQAIAQKLQAARDTSETGQAWFIKQIPTVLKLDNKEFPRFVDALKALSKGENPGAITPDIQQAITEWSQAIPQIRQAASEAGLDMGDLGQYYFPQNYSELLKNQAGLNKAANDLVKSGQASNIGEALQQLQFMKRQYSTKFGHFENSRTVDLPGFDKSKNALISYIDGAFNKIGQVEQFGPKGEQASQLISQLGNEGHDAERASRLLKIANGTEEYNQPAIEKVSSAARAFNRVTKLGLSAILNIGQLTNTATKGGVLNTGKNISKFLTKSDRDFVDATGVNADSVLSNLREQTGISGKVTSKITAPGFNAVERVNRGTSALVGRDMANVLHEKALAGNAKAEQALRELGVEGPLGDTLTPQQQIQAGRKFVEQTQFKVDPQDLPAWADSPMGKMAAQFRTFSYKQQKFMWDEVVKQAAQGNVLPLVRFITVGTAVGYVTGNIRGLLRGQPATQIKGNQDHPTTSVVGQFLSALNNVGASGLASGPVFVAQNVKSARFPQYLASTFGGPTAGLAVQTATNVQQAAAGNPKALERQGLSSVPIGGPLLSNKLMPYNPKTGKSLKPGDAEVPIKDANGQPILDAKGNPTTVVIPKGVTGAPKDQMVADATQKAVQKQLEGTLNPQEKALYGLGNAKIEKLHNEGKIDDATYDHVHALYQVSEGVKSGLSPKNKALARQPDTVIQKAYDDGKINDATYKEISDYKNGLKSINGKGDYAPEALTNKDAQNFYKTYNSKLTAYDQKKFLKLETKPEQSAVNITNSLNKQLPPGLAQFKPTNQLAKDYADYEKKINSNPQYDEVEKLNSLKTFLLSASKNQHSEDVKSIYNEGSSGDLKKLLKAGKLTPDSLKEAIALDNNLYTSGVTDALKFKAAFRNANGFGTPTTQNTLGGGSGSGGSGNGSSSANSVGKAQVTTKNGITKNVGINAQGFDANSPIGLSNIVPRNLTFSKPVIDTTPTKKTFKIVLPSDVTGTPRPSRVVSLRAKRARIL